MRGKPGFVNGSLAEKAVYEEQHNNRNGQNSFGVPMGNKNRGHAAVRGGSHAYTHSNVYNGVYAYAYDNANDSANTYSNSHAYRGSHVHANGNAYGSAPANGGSYAYTNGNVYGGAPANGGSYVFDGNLAIEQGTGYNDTEEFENQEAKSKEKKIEETIAANRDILKREAKMRRERRIVRVKYISMVTVLFVLFVAMIYRYSMVIEINSVAIEHNNDLNKIRNSADVLKKDISRETDLEKIRILAESRLNMQKPDAHQYIYIKVPRKDHALLRPDSTGSQGDGRGITLRERVDEIIDRIWLR